MTDPGHTRPSGPVLVDTMVYPREFSFSLVCSLALHLAAVAVLLQGGRLPAVETVRDVFLTPDWTVAPAVRDPRPPGAGALELPSRSAPPPRVANRPPSPSPRKAEPRPAGEERIAKAIEPAPAASAPKPVAPPAARPAPTKSEAPASVQTVAPDAIAPPLPPAPVAPRTEERPAPRVEEPPALALPPRAASPEPPVASAPVHGPVQMPPAPVERPTPTLDPPPAATAVAQQPAPKIEDRPLPPPSEWREAQPLVPAPALTTTTPLDVPVAPPAPALGLSAPPSTPPAVAAVVPPAPVPSPLDWEVPSAPERDVSSAGRASDGNPGAVTPAAPAATAVAAPKVERPQAPPVPGVAAAGQGRSPGTSGATTAPQAGPVMEPLVGFGTAADYRSGALSSQRTGERAALSSGSEGARGAAATTTAPSLGRETTGPAGVAAGEQSGTDARIGAPAGTGAITAGTPSGTGQTTGGSAPPDAGTEAGTGTGGQAVAQGGTAGASQEAGAGGRGPGGVAITTPRNGYTLGPDEPPIVIVRGEVENPEITTIALTANSRRIEVPVRDKKFNYPLVVIDPTTKISAEVPLPAGRRSEAIVVHAAPNAPTTGVILLDWGEAKPGGGIDMGATWRARADRLDGQQMKLFVKSAPLPDDIPVSAFYLRNMQAGVYTFILGYRGLGGGTPFVPRFFLTSPGIPTARDLKPVKLAGTGKTAAVRFLLPQAVLWEQDDWFTGRSEASDTITKFRDDGTTWIERKGEVR